jgi:CYTH domain-containing protein
MALEIERKFLLKDESWRGMAEPVHYLQGYMAIENGMVVKVRIIGGKGYISIKSQKRGIVRLEYEYEIPVGEAREMLDEMCVKPLIDKRRSRIEFEGLVWEVDEFLGENEGLVVAEVELSSEDEQFDKPAWVGREVTDDPRYFNSSLIDYPYKNWQDI